MGELRAAKTQMAGLAVGINMNTLGAVLAIPGGLRMDGGFCNARGLEGFVEPAL